MPRIPEQALQRLRQRVSVQHLVEAAGIALKKAGKDQLGRCPFHDDREASLVVTPAKNLWHCFGCGIGGGPIDWVIKQRGVGFREAVALLEDDPALAAAMGDEERPAAPAPRAGTRTLAAAPLAPDADDRALLAQAIDYYHRRLQQSPEALAYLKARGLVHPQLIDTFKLGVADRTLGLLLPEKNRKDGAAIRARLQKIGILRDSGHEHFNGSLVVPIFDAQGQVAEVYGRKLRDDLRAGTPKHLYLPGPHAGVFNLAGVVAAGQRAPGQRDVIVCEALIDALTFWCAGCTNVTSAYGAEGFTDDILRALQAHAIERVLIAYDRDTAGDRAADKLAERLIGEGFEVLRVVFPPGLDANEYACTTPPAAQALAVVLRQARWIGGSARASAPVEQAAAKKEEPALAPSAAEPAAAASPPQQQAELPDELHVEAAACSWRVRGWKKNTTAEAMRVNVQVRRKDGVGNEAIGGYHLDTLDLYAARSRAAFVRCAAVELGLAEDSVKRELGAVLLELEALQDRLLEQSSEQPKAHILSADEEAEALALLRDPELPQRIVADLHALGVVGEDLNLLAAYLAATSRKLDAPLAVLVQSSSAAGKSSLMDAVLQLVPDEDLLRYSAMTGQSLFYLGENNLSHKVLAIAEEEGVRQAAYALKLLQSDGELSIASTAKDEASGKLVTRQYKVRGPVMLMLTTTAIDIDEELMNRCLVLAVNESAEQTQAIHARQRRRQTLHGLLEQADKAAIRQRHHNAQRLLANVAVVNPYAERLSFLADKTRTRRDHMKYLSLINAVALLHQHQREVRSIEHQGKALAYIEATREDIALANRIAHEVLGRTLDELPPQTRRLLQLVRAMVTQRANTQGVKAADVRFTRRDVRQATRWSDNQLKVHCARLADMEYLLVHAGSRGHALRYELLWDGADDAQGRHLCGLIDAEALDANNDAHGYDDRKLDRGERKLGSSWPQVGPKLDIAPRAQTRADAGAAADVVRDARNTPVAARTSSSAAVVAAAAR
jgi:DNA primase